MEHFSPLITYLKGSLNSLPDFLSRPSGNAPVNPLVYISTLAFSKVFSPSWFELTQIFDAIVNDNPDSLSPSDFKKNKKQLHGC